MITARFWSILWFQIGPFFAFAQKRDQKWVDSLGLTRKDQAAPHKAQNFARTLAWYWN